MFILHINGFHIGYIREKQILR